MIADNVEMGGGETARWYAASMGSATFGVGGNATDRASGEFTISYLGPLLVNE